MEVLDLIFSDFAAANEAGKFTLVGAGFSRITAPILPYIHPLMFVFIRFKITIQDRGRNKVEIQFVGEKGPFFKAECDVNVSENHKEEEHLPLPLQIVNLKFDEPGPYNVEVRINGGAPKSHQLTIVHPVPSKAN